MIIGRNADQRPRTNKRTDRWIDGPTYRVQTKPVKIKTTCNFFHHTQGTAGNILSFLFWRGRGSIMTTRPRLQNRRGGAIEMSSKTPEPAGTNRLDASRTTTREAWTEISIQDQPRKRAKNRKLFATSTSTYLCFLAVSGASFEYVRSVTASNKLRHSIARCK